MGMLRQLLLQTDDEYLIGLSNKGIVKRAYKDLEQEKPSVIWQEDCAEVTLKDAVCKVRVSLGESSCSCPSRSVCRHLITAILWLKQNAEEVAQEESGSADAGAAELVKEDTQSEAAAMQEVLLRELLSVPAEKLKKACKNKKYREFAERIQAGERAEIQEGSIVTVYLPWENATVKLLSPLEYSTCTCHSRELCVHKAQAILSFQLEKGILTPEHLQKDLRQESTFDAQALSEAVTAIKEVVRLQLLTGLSRLSPEAAESMERLAIICHRAGLADYEALCRTIASEYALYKKRSAAFRTEELTEKLLELYHLALCLEQAKDTERIARLAGNFRDTYRPVSRLHLTAVGGRNFHSKTGYEGENYYFLETEQKKWYTWTDARPVFYEGMRRRPVAQSGQSAAPWGLNCSREQMMELEFYLEQAKATEDGRLSVSQETKSEIVGERNLKQEALAQMIYWDYGKLLQEVFGTEQEGFGLSDKNEGRERLALVAAVGCEESRFDSVLQRFTMGLWDKKGNRLSIALRYSKEEQYTIRVLERLSSRLKKQGMKHMVFFGIPYLEQGELFLYPIEFFEGGPWEDGLIDMGAEVSAQMEMDDPGKREQGSCLPLDSKVLAEMERFLKELRQVSADLFQSGLASVQEEALQILHRLAEESEQLGLHGAAKELGILEEGLQSKRHRMDFEPEPIIRAWIRFYRYLRAGRGKVSLDQALVNLQKEYETHV